MGPGIRRIGVSKFGALFFLISCVTATVLASTRVNIQSHQKVCAAQLTLDSTEDHRLVLRVAREDRVRRVRISELNLPETPDAWVPQWFVQPIVQMVANRQIGADDENITLRKADEFSFHFVSFLPVDEKSLLAHFEGEHTWVEGETSLSRQFSVQVLMRYIKGNWENFVANRPVVLELYPHLRQVLECALTGGDNHLNSVLCSHAHSYLSGRYSVAPPVDYSYENERPPIQFTGTAKRLSFTGIILDESLTFTIQDQKETGTAEAAPETES